MLYISHLLLTTFIVVKYVSQWGKKFYITKKKKITKYIVKQKIKEHTIDCFLFEL